MKRRRRSPRYRGGSALVRGTTNPIVLTINDQNVDLTSYDTVYVTFKQMGAEKLRKTNSELTISTQSVTVQLTQAEALTFSPDVTVEVQLNWTWSVGGKIERGATLTGELPIFKNLESGELA